MRGLYLEELDVSAWQWKADYIGDGTKSAAETTRSVELQFQMRVGRFPKGHYAAWAEPLRTMR